MSAVSTYIREKTMKNSIILCTVILVAFAGQAVAAIVIDNFEEGDFSFTATSGSGVQGTQSGSTSNIIGGGAVRPFVIAQRHLH